MPALPTLKVGSRGSYVKWLQMNVNGLALNYNGFAIDGVFDTKTEEAIKNFQDRFLLNSNGIVSTSTWKVLNDNVRAVQNLLNLNGYRAGAPDGWFGPVTTSAVRTFQSDNGLYPSGIVDPRTRQRLFNPRPKDNYEYRPSSNDLTSLHPYVALLARRFLQLTQENNLDIRITTAFRSWDEEDRLFAQGRWAPGQIVTNARGGDSYHNWGLAFDAAPFENGKMSTDTQKFIQMGQLGQQVGLQWGGTFKSIVDYPHFQYTFGLNTWDLLNGVRPAW
ncbi:peptidoglycan-binding protein [Alicyclobacillus tolerans]|uniref:peptidoglycan-binding protein n=1 Tax=Alicyclobacillus tolerans TaxID=90970 RepID=UPI001F22C7F4|nr:peptidoglycan-binding protein [Alicyclobacillus tolerans]MCF8566735.1 peptidoglycan-binding protein [Alicyclobacillus tolerans]